MAIEIVDLPIKRGDFPVRYDPLDSNAGSGRAIDLQRLSFNGACRPGQRTIVPLVIISP